MRHSNQKKQLVAEARKIARQVDSWIGLSNALADPQDGLIARYFPDAHERQAFLSSPEYEELNQLLLRTIKRKGLYPKTSNGRSNHNGG
jgi:hypothetical protein